MDPERWERIEALFFGALDRDAAEREAFLDAACADDPALRREIEAMLAAHEHSQGLLLEHRLLTGDLTTRSDPGALLGTHIGPYRLQTLLGEGGMGAVYLAERDDAHYRQEVALKLIRPGLHTAEVVTRFRVERQILARLQHPHIARLLDGGLTEGGQPYLVMEYVAGTPLTHYCDAHRLPIADRLRLFQTVCQAVQFAHRNLIVHRDLKPTNILVTDEGQVKLLDFGIAKLLDPTLADVSVAQTRTEMRLLTPEYAAPEQIRGEAITTATDVYALGVVLYELLTGRRPYRLAERRQAEVERIICEEEPTRPSTVVTGAEEVTRANGTTEAVTPERVSAARATQAARLRRTLQGDLDNIVMMALRKEPERRYASAEQLAEDIGRYLEGRVVIARKDTLAYRVGKFARRNRVGVGVAAGFLLVLIGFSVVTAGQARRIARERDKAEQVSSFLASIFAAADPAAARGDTLTALELLDRGAARIETELADQAAVQADLLDVMSSAYLSQGAYDRAEALARHALAFRANTDALPQSLTRLAEALQAQSRFAEADSLFRIVVAHHRAQGDDDALIDALEQRGRFLIAGLGSPDTVKTVFEEALALRRRHYGTDDPGRGRLLRLYANVYHIGGDYATAERLFREALSEQRRFPDDPAGTSETLYELGTILSVRRQYTEADTLLREAVALREQLYGRTHPTTAELLVHLATNLIRMERFDEAERLLREALATHEQHSGRESMGYHGTLRSLRLLLTDAGRYEEAVGVAREVVELTATLYGADSRSYATNLSFYAQVLYHAGRPADALAIYHQALPLLAAAFGDDVPFYAHMLAETAKAMQALERIDEAETLYRQAYAVMSEKLAPGSFMRSETALQLGQLLIARGGHAEALPLFEDAAAVRVGDSVPAAKLAARAAHALGASLLVLERPAEAEPHLRTAVEAFQTLSGDDDAQTHTARRDLNAAQAALHPPGR